MHRHKLHTDSEFTVMGNIEVKKVMEQLQKLVDGSDDVKKLFSQKPHMTWDNYFSGEGMMNYIGKQGFGCIMTCRRDRLPAGIEGKYLHKKKTDSTDRTRAARFLEPVVAIKQFKSDKDEYEPYERVHVSFQSTSSCNFTTVNSLNYCLLQKEKRERGIGKNKRTWGIEMNAGRRLYLSTYNRIDLIDHLVKNCKMKYWTWKY